MTSETLTLEEQIRQIQLECQRNQIHGEYKMMKTIKQLEGRELTYSNQQEAALKVIEAFQRGIYVVILVAQPGAGKTGVMLEVSRLLTTHSDDKLCVLAKDMFIASGMCDLDWKEQMRKNFFPALKENIYHRGEILSIEKK